MSDRDYCYPPDYTVLRNNLDIRDAPALEAAERELVAQRLLEPVPAGDFDLAHLKAIHRHLFQDVYAWAGEIRTVEIARGESRFQPTRFIETGMADIHHRIVAARYFAGLGPDEFAGGAGPVLGDVNHVHPFREGNGRTQLQYLKQLAARAEHVLDLTRLDRTAWLDASRRSNTGDQGRRRRALHDRPRYRRADPDPREAAHGALLRDKEGRVDPVVGVVHRHNQIPPLIRDPLMRGAILVQHHADHRAPGSLAPVRPPARRSVNPAGALQRVPEALTADML